jgi:hypothetical protein
MPGAQTDQAVNDNVRGCVDQMILRLKEVEEKTKD